MKRKTIAATIIAAALLVVISLKFFQSKPSPSFSITGKWQIDSAYAAVPVSDSIQSLIATVNPGPEKNISWLKFNADSIVNRLSSKDSSEEKYYLHDSVLYIYELNDYAPYRIRTMTDTLVEFMNRDNVVFVLKKH